MDSLVSLLENTPHQRVPAELVRLIRSGLAQEDFVAALTLAAARNVQPIPDVGFKYHSVMVMQAIRLTVSRVDEHDRWLPAFWAVDYFKRMQASEQSESGWQLSPRASTRVSHDAGQRRLIEALDRWDYEAADAAIIDYAPVASLAQLFSILIPYGARDLREIGHKAITVQNTHRLIDLFGPGQAEPVLRSTVAALLNTADDGNPATGDYAADRPWREHQSLVDEFPAGWQAGRDDPVARTEFLETLRVVPEHEAGRQVVDLLQRGISPATIWETLFVAAGELIMRDPSVVPVHAQTTANALHYCFRHSTDERTQRLLLLQCAAFIAMFTRLVGNQLADVRIDALEPIDVSGDTQTTIEEILADLPENRLRAAGRTLGLLAADDNPEAIMAAARHYLALNGDDSHDYKFLEAAFENHAQFTDALWSRRFLAASIVYATGSSAQSRSRRVIDEARELIRA